MDLSKYSQEQQEAIKSIGNVCVLASAGAGKTAVLMARTAYLIKERNVKPENILLITFSKKASEIMKERLEKLVGKNDVNIGTFHSIFYKILRQEDDFYRNARIMREYDKKKIICDSVVRNLRLERIDNDVAVADILRFIDMQKQYCKYYDAKQFIQCSDEPIHDDKTMGKIYKDYELSKKKQNLMDFQDMIFGAYKMFKENPQILSRYQKIFTHFLVDECMDSPLQQIELIQMLNKNNEQTFFVGDAKQSLFSFIGGSPEYILNFDKLFNNATILHLTKNYRSSNNIVKFSNKLFENSEESQHQFYKEVVANKGNHKEPEYTIYPNTIEESYAIGEKIKDIMSKDNTLKWKDFAVIYRCNAQSCSVEQAFAELQIPYVVYSTSKSFFELREIQDMLAFLKLGLNKDNKSFQRIYCVPLRFLGKQFLLECTEMSINKNCTLYDAMNHLPSGKNWRYKKGIEELNEIYQTVSRKIGKTNVGDIIRIIRKLTQYDKYITKESDCSEVTSKSDKVDNLESLCEQASRYVDLERFLSDIDRIIMNKEEQVQANNKDKYANVNAVGMASSHRFKGSEFKHVFGISINDNLYPHYKATNIGEELRNLYVMVSRAEEGLYLSSTLRNGNKKCSPSKFLEKVFSKEYIAKQIQICNMNNGNMKIGL